MRVFNCDHCGHLVFFDSVQCLRCGSQLAYVPALQRIAALTPADAPHESLWRVVDGGEARYRLCQHHLQRQACNFAIAEDDPQPLCVSCRQTRVLPDLSDAGNLRRWKLVEAAKRQLFYTLARMGLESAESTQPPAFEFLADVPGAAPVMTGHFNGTITLNVAEADDDERTRRRVALGEPYRTLLGHLRHESGHFLWQPLVYNAGLLSPFRAIFGDERADYGEALQRHYRDGAPADWAQRHVSAYATAHPWEDWAETWAHYLHMVDLLETAAAYQTGLTVPSAMTHRLEAVSDPFSAPAPSFDEMTRQWVPLTLLLNSLNRSLGQQDAYPFALTTTALHKLRFVHDVVHERLRPPPLSP